MHACRLYNNKIVHLSRYLSQVKHMCHVKWLPAYLQFMVTINWLLKIINCLKQNLKIYIYIMLFIILLLYIIVDLNFYVNGSIPISYEDWMHDSLNFLIHRSDDGFWPGRFHMLWYNLHVQVTACIDIIQYVNTFIIPMSNELHENIIHSVCWHSGFAVIWGRSWVGVESVGMNGGVGDVVHG